MNRFLFSVLVASSCSVFAEPIKSSIYSCDYAIKNRGTSGSLTVELKKGVVNKVSFDNFYIGLPDKMGYSCVMEASRNDNETKWKDNNNITTVEFDDASEYEGGDYMTISPKKSGYIIDLKNTISSMKCGAGAELPKILTITKLNKKCKVKL